MELATPSVIVGLVDGARQRARRRVARLRADFPGEDEVALGERLVRSAANRAGLWGAATGTLALVTLPVGLPAGVAVSLALEAELILALLEVYGLSVEGEAGRMRLYALWAGAGFADAAKSAGLRMGARALGRVLTESLPARIIARINPVLLRAILRRLGLGWLPRALKLWPVLGAPIGFALDRAALKALGAATLATLDDAAREQRKARRRAADQPAIGRQPKPAAPRRAKKTLGPRVERESKATRDSPPPRAKASRKPKRKSAAGTPPSQRSPQASPGPAANPSPRLSANPSPPPPPPPPIDANANANATSHGTSPATSPASATAPGAPRSRAT